MLDHAVCNLQLKSLFTKYISHREEAGGGLRKTGLCGDYIDNNVLCDVKINLQESNNELCNGAGGWVIICVWPFPALGTSDEALRRQVSQKMFKKRAKSVPKKCPRGTK